MFYYAITYPKRISYPESYSEDISKMNSVIYRYRNGGFMKPEVAQSGLIDSLTRSKLLSLGEGNTPSKAITNCLKNCVFGLSEEYRRHLLANEDEEYCGTILPKKPFTIEDLSIRHADDAVSVCFVFFQSKLIELVRIK